MFDNLNYLAPAKTLSFTLHGVVTPPANEPIVLELVYGGRGTAFFNEYAKVQATAPGAGVPAEERAAYLERVGRVFAQHAVVGWKNAYDGAKEVPFSTTTLAALIGKLVRLPDASGAPVGRWDLVERAISASLDADNFTEPMPTAEELGKG